MEFFGIFDFFPDWPSQLGLCLSILYWYVIFYYSSGWKQLPAWEIPSDFHPSTRVSVLVPARNEEANIEACLSSVLNQKYPDNLLEVVAIDDHSSDRTFELASRLAAQNPNLKALRLSDFEGLGDTLAFKKKAIEMGIDNSSGTPHHHVGCRL